MSFEHSAQDQEMLEKGKAVVVQNAAPAASFVNGENLAETWAQMILLLQKEIGPAACKSWIAPISPLRFEKGILELAVPTRFIRDWVKTHYAERIRHLWARHFGTIIRVETVVGTASSAAPAAPGVPAVSAPAPAGEAPAVAADPLSSQLEARFTFDNFVIGASNELACAAVRRVAAGDASFNPLFLYGGVGLGKTHLMQAAAAEIRAQATATAARPRRVAYMSAEKFMYQFVRALRAKEMVSFKEAFRSVDVLMIDDIQFICGKEATQEEFFHTFNALMSQGAQVVISADRLPAELEGIDERLRSRLGGGLTVALRPATYELRLGILAKKCALMGRTVPPEVLELLAQKITASVRELEGALNRIIAQAELTGRPVTLETAQDLLHDVLRFASRRVSVEDIQRKVAEHYNIRLSDMHSPRRAVAVARPRQVAMYLAKALTENSLPEIGRKFGGRDHTTIMHGVRRIEELVAQDSALQQDVEKLKRAIAG